MIEEERTFYMNVGGYMKTEIDTTFLLFLYQNVLTCTLCLKKYCLYICSIYNENENENENK